MEDPQPRSARLLRMELHAHHVDPLNGRCEGFNVMGDGCGIGRYGAFVRVRKVDVLAGDEAGEKT